MGKAIARSEEVTHLQDRREVLQTSKYRLHLADS